MIGSTNKGPWREEVPEDAAHYWKIKGVSPSANVGKTKMFSVRLAPFDERNPQAITSVTVPQLEYMWVKDPMDNGCVYSRGGSLSRIQSARRDGKLVLVIEPF